MLRLPAPAKVNLFLHITGRRADGYHTLQTLFQLLDHGDELGFARREDSELRLLDPLPGGSLLRPGEFGWDGAAGTWFSVNPADDMTVVYMVQRLPASHMRFIPRLQATIYAAL